MQSANEQNTPPNEGAQLAEELRTFEIAKRRKFRRFLTLASAFLVLAIISISLGIVVPDFRGLFIGIGVLLVIAAIFSFLIALINPFSSDVRNLRRQRTEADEFFEG